MTSIALHPRPSSQSVAIEEFRSVGLALRAEAFFFLGALSLLAILAITNTVRMVHMNPGANLHAGMMYSASGAIPVFLVALFIPFGVWRAEDPARRAYHWSMPVARGPHTIMKFLCGWVWLMIAAVVYLLFIIGIATVIPMITGEPNRLGAAPAWEWLVTFTAPTLAYLLVSIAVIGSNHAWRWIGGLVVGYWVVVGVLVSFGLPEAGHALQSIVDGSYGLNAALFGSVSTTSGPITIGVTREMMRVREMSNWLVAMPIWVIGSAIAVAIASYRHRD